MPWRNYSSIDLERQYNPRLSIPDFDYVIAPFQVLSEETRNRHPHRNDVRYGPGNKETFDFFPASEPNAPIHIFFHGGYWRAQDKREHAFVARDLVGEGFNVIIANYDLCPDVTIEEIIEQAIRCVLYTHKHGHELGGDPSRISISGHSAGGQIVAKLCANRFSGPLIKAAVAISGVFHLEPLRFTSINEAARMTEETAKINSPYHDPAPENVAPLLMLGGGESEEFHRQSEEYAEKCRIAGHEVDVIPVGTCNHIDVLPEIYLKGGEGYRAFLKAIT
ncbi:alpha/beta hydrolase [Aestuariispira insulae]|uniref:Arylformamidase n=1 Tax=Aestuariispira insulae TaxID=1461337 RepID=A0A3D9HI03_9PROT|nr:alpha/beta hydrolase [Aestuariispira insulae]RED49074.1 arylformamidase [Aestuariispira insulae]